MSKTLAGCIDHTLLKADATEKQIRNLCLEAIEYHFKSVCVNTAWTSCCVELLKNSGVITCVVVGFPLGAMDMETKAFEARRAVDLGAGEVDMVINIGFLKSGKNDMVHRDIAAVIKAAGNATVKVIIEACLLTNKEKLTACMIARDAGAAFVKTSTGMSIHGATIEDVRLMRETVGPEMGVKAAGGIKNLQNVIVMLEAGANRIGTSSGIQILADENPDDGS